MNDNIRVSLPVAIIRPISEFTEDMLPCLVGDGQHWMWVETIEEDDEEGVRWFFDSPKECGEWRQSWEFDCITYFVKLPKLPR